MEVCKLSTNRRLWKQMRNAIRRYEQEAVGTGFDVGVVEHDGVRLGAVGGCGKVGAAAGAF